MEDLLTDKRGRIIDMEENTEPRTTPRHDVFLTRFGDVLNPGGNDYGRSSP